MLREEGDTGKTSPRPCRWENRFSCSTLVQILGLKNKLRYAMQSRCATYGPTVDRLVNP